MNINIKSYYMDVSRTQALKEKLNQIKSSKSENEENEPENRFEGIILVFSLFLKSTIFWLTLNQLDAKFPTYFVKFGYWETVLYTFAVSTFISLFKSKK